MYKNNKGYSAPVVLGFVIFLSFIFYYLYTFFIENPVAFKAEPVSKEIPQNINYQETDKKVTIKDNKNNYSIEIDISKSFSFSKKGIKVSKLEKSIKYNEDKKTGTFSFTYNPEQNIVLSEGSAMFYVDSKNESFNPEIYWKDYLNNKSFMFKYRELKINGFKAYTTANEPGIGLNVSTIVVINPNHYVIFGYIPYMADYSEFDNPNYNLVNSKEPVIQNYFDIINSIKKIK